MTTLDAAGVRAMINEDRKEWARLTAMLDAHPEGALHNPESPEWTARDVYAHLARWIAHSTDDFGRVAEGGAALTIEGDDDEINTRWQAEDASLSLSEARARAQAAFERRISAIESLEPDGWNPSLEAIARADGADHYRGHMSYIVAS